MTDRVAPTLPPDVFESVVNALAATLVPVSRTSDLAMERE
jgi:hypothetical protein